MLVALNAFLAALNTWLYVMYDSPFSLAAAVFIGLLTIALMVSA